MTPWPRYPCHPCSRPGKCGVVRYGPDVWDVRYGEASTYAWHTACWNRTTGRWRAVCCEGHVRKGRTR